MSRSTVLLSTVAASALFAALWALAQGKSLSIDVPAQAQPTMAQAVVIAESQGKGRATRAHLEENVAQPVYRITVKAPSEAPLRIDVAAADGRIVASERQKD
jgi:uncharacterized membrane protein YkoI